MKGDIVSMSITYHEYLVHQADLPLREIKHPLVCVPDVADGASSIVSVGDIFQCDHNEEGTLKFYVVKYVDFVGRVVSCAEYQRGVDTTTADDQRETHLIPLDVVELCFGN